MDNTKITLALVKLTEKFQVFLPINFNIKYICYFWKFAIRYLSLNMDLKKYLKLIQNINIFFLVFYVNLKR